LALPDRHSSYCRDIDIVRMSFRYLLLLSLLSSIVQASPTTIGCVSQELLGGLLGALLGGTFNNVLSASDCAVGDRFSSGRWSTDVQTRCVPGGRTFSYWRSDVSRCYCSNNGVDIRSLSTTAVTVGQSSSTTPLCPSGSYHVSCLICPY
jgi:hypothetical protein